MALFGRGRNTDSVPQEVKDYYEAERRERSGMAWLLALATLVVTLVLAGGIFLGGRWAYRKVVDRNDGNTQVADKAKEASSTNQPKDTATTDDTNEDNNTSTNPSTSSTNTDSNSAQPNPPAASQPSTPSGGSSSTPAATGTGSNNPTTPTTGAPAASSTPASTPAPAASNNAATAATAPASGKLTNTGPETILPAFVAVTVFAALGHYGISARRAKRDLM